MMTRSGPDRLHGVVALGHFYRFRPNAFGQCLLSARPAILLQRGSEPEVWFPSKTLGKQTLPQLGSNASECYSVSRLSWVRIVERARRRKVKDLPPGQPSGQLAQTSLTVDVGAYTSPEGFVRRPAVNVFSNQESIFLRISFLSLPVTIFFAETLSSSG